MSFWLSGGPKNQTSVESEYFAVRNRGRRNYGPDAASSSEGYPRSNVARLQPRADAEPAIG